jgi:hypothetical protein
MSASIRSGSTGWTWKARRRPADSTPASAAARLGEQPDDLLIGGLGEIGVVQADGVQGFGRLETNDLVALGLELADARRRRDRRARMRRPGLFRLTPRKAAFMVAPVATPSSTTIAKRPSIATGAAPPR